SVDEQEPGQGRARLGAEFAFDLAEAVEQQPGDPGDDEDGGGRVDEPFVPARELQRELWWAFHAAKARGPNASTDPSAWMPKASAPASSRQHCAVAEPDSSTLVSASVSIAECARTLAESQRRSASGRWSQPPSSIALVASALLSSAISIRGA